MYEELINKLRKMRDVSTGLSALLPKSGGEVVANLYGEAADAIEKLSKYADYVDTIKRLKSEGWYLQQAKSHEGCNAIATMPLPEPPKEET